MNRLPAQQTRSLSFVVAGNAKPLMRHQTRVVKTKDKRVFASQYDPKENEMNRAYVRQACQDAMRAGGYPIFEGPLDVTVSFYLLQPTGKRVRDPERIRPDILLEKACPVVKPDLDNLIKLVFDALNKVAWRDDTQIVRLTTEKRYELEKPRTEVVIRPLTVSEVMESEAHLFGVTERAVAAGELF